MTSQRCALTAAGLLLFSFAATAGEVDFTKDIAPLLAKNCVACHNAKTAEGGLNLESHQALMAGGDSGDSIVAGNADESYLYARVSGAEEPLMPPEDNSVGAQPLNDEELKLLRAWIVEGGLAGEAMGQTVLQWNPLPANLQPVYALDSSPDGQHFAFGHGNALIVAPASDSPDELEFLVDASLKQPQAAHLDIVQSIAFSPDSQRLATGGYRTVKIWKRNTGAQGLLSGLSTDVKLSSLSADGALLATVSQDMRLEITHIESGLSVRFLKAHAQPITAAAWLGGTHLLVTCDAEGRWFTTNADTQQTTPLELEPPIVATKLLGLSNESLLAIDQAGQVLSITLHASAQPTVTPIPGLPHTAQLVILDAEATRGLAVNDNGHAAIFDLATQQVQRELELGADVADVAVSPSGTQLAVRRSNGLVELWEMETGQRTAELNQDYLVRQQVQTADRQVVRQKNQIEGLASQIPVLQKAAEKEAEAKQKVADARKEAADALAKEAQAVETAQAAVTQAEQAVAEANAAVEAAQKKAAEMVAQLEAKKKAAEEAEAKRVTAESQLKTRDQALAVATESAERATKAIPELESKIEGEKQRLANLETSLQQLQTQVAPAPAKAVAFARGRVAVASEDQMVRVYAASGEPLASLPAGEALLAVHVKLPSQELLAVTQAGQLISWDPRLSWKLERTIGSDLQSPLSDRVTALDFSPDGKLLAIGSGPPSRSGELRILEVESGQLRDQFGDIHSDTVLAVRFSPDGRQLATGSADKLSKLFDVESGELIRSFEGHTHHVLDIAWRDDGRQLATASADATVKLWDVASGSQDRTLNGFKKEPTSLAFVGQSHQLAIAAADGSVRLVNADDGKVIKSFTGAEDALFRVSTLATGKQVLAGGQAGRVWTWQIEDAKLVRTLPVTTP